MRGTELRLPRSGIWASLDATYLTGGRTYAHGVQSIICSITARGGYAGVPLGRPHSIKLTQQRVSAPRKQLRLMDCLAYRWGGDFDSRRRWARSTAPASAPPVAFA